MHRLADKARNTIPFLHYEENPKTTPENGPG